MPCISLPSWIRDARVKLQKATKRTWQMQARVVTAVAATRKDGSNPPGSSWQVPASVKVPWTSCHELPLDKLLRLCSTVCSVAIQAAELATSIVCRTTWWVTIPDM